MRGIPKLLLALTLAAACGGERPLVAMGCLSDSDCDPGDVCVDGRCEGTASGAPDAGATDAGVAAGRLAVQPPNVSVTVQAGAQPAPAVFDLGNAGGAPIRFAVACDGNATPSPSSAYSHRRGLPADLRDAVGHRRRAGHHGRAGRGALGDGHDRRNGALRQIEGERPVVAEKLERCAAVRRVRQTFRRLEAEGPLRSRWVATLTRLQSRRVVVPVETVVASRVTA